MRKKARQNNLSGGWWYARGSGASRKWCQPVEAATAGEAIRKFESKSDDLIIYGPFGSLWEAWTPLQEWLAALPKQPTAGEADATPEETRDKAGP